MPTEEDIISQTVDTDSTSQMLSSGMLTSDVTSLDTSVASTPSFMAEVEAKADNLHDSSWMGFGGPVVTSSRFNMDEEYEIDFSSSDSEESEIEETPTADFASETAGLSTDIDLNETMETTEPLPKERVSDPFIVQIQLKCCIKILADELRFLPHALLEQFDPELGPFGGRAKLRVKVDSGPGTTSPTNPSLPHMMVLPGANKLGLKVCQWLKNEIDTICKICNLKYSDVVLCDLEESDAEVTILAESEFFTFKLEESILTVLLLFCILHGDLDYNLAALRLELLFLLQVLKLLRKVIITSC